MCVNALFFFEYITRAFNSNIVGLPSICIHTCQHLFTFCVHPHLSTLVHLLCASTPFNTCSPSVCIHTCQHLFTFCVHPHLSTRVHLLCASTPFNTCSPFVCIHTCQHLFTFCVHPHLSTRVHLLLHKGRILFQFPCVAGCIVNVSYLHWIPRWAFRFSYVLGKHMLT